jgi:hypothetical protein
MKQPLLGRIYEKYGYFEQHTHYALSLNGHLQ